MRSSRRSPRVRPCVCDDVLRIIVALFVVYTCVAEYISVVGSFDIATSAQVRLPA
jgi:hypothetical protein